MSHDGGLDIHRHREIAWRGGRTTSTSRLVAEESAIALTYGGSTHAVMMGTPADLEDLGVGFSLTEGIIGRASEIGSIELISNELGMEVRMWLDGDRASTLAARRRAISGPVGCGLCGIESLEQARRAPSRVEGHGIAFHARDLLNAMQALSPLQGNGSVRCPISCRSRPSSSADRCRSPYGANHGKKERCRLRHLSRSGPHMALLQDFGMTPGPLFGH
ncbi:formate dehydrogenase accessory sulfurtransferase FdhD [Bradyrhizobium symbiodeficiens]|uniref:formate dehydrogenase accessory sulfurtransferase FdhD n=1 Tax=Bradyrhizobium symbiodeficiens TaxID=1404367 RepID=UPI0030D57122